MRQIFLLLVFCLILSAPVHAAPVRVFCAEAFWCDLARGLGGDAVRTESILVSPAVDPHDFQVTPVTVRALASADIVIWTGGHYDDWIPPLLAAQPDPGRQDIAIADLVPDTDRANPHLADDPAAARALIDRLSASLTTRLSRHPAGAEDSVMIERIAREKRRYDRQFDALTGRLDALRTRYAGLPVAVGEPVGGPVFRALGLRVVDADFALATMRHEDPSPRDVARLEDALRGREVRAFVTNPAMRVPSVIRLERIAREAGIPVVSLDEFPPPGLSWQDWMTDRIDRLQRALDRHE
ncbi:metal ABC transporter solute-binding protein, Zn/Mn family [Swaminathania salitolerans]|uniref:Metal ABC transporter substrate-binding protein n=1 Tax=Swaminathania salitolerans TaxID=182838 RepID=A0A511BQT5_9PROT|nr:zinc ABC transporter substrate-binding protein [Swaminathania salitolerans]GBQ12030.1 ABC transporter substrate-binding periplasmic protein [Swaminathania salitolerans LMG 21291]GEL02706.1 metal ABC transporter substrate-binding protein [Swaminathania salitolerans]